MYEMEDEDEDPTMVMRDAIRQFRERIEQEIQSASSHCENKSPDSSVSSDIDHEIRELKHALQKANRELKIAASKQESLEKDNLKLHQILDKETRLRREALDELMAIKGNIRVFVRLRPQIHPRPVSQGLAQTVEKVDERTLVLKPYDNKRFEYDAFFPENITNENLFATQVSPIVYHVMDGTNCTLIAYGQTGSGKTHTMLGEEKDSGMARRAFKLALEIANLRGGNSTFSLSALQVYNEHIQDLMASVPIENSNLQVKQNGESKSGMSVFGLHQVEIRTMGDVEMLIGNACKRRTVSSHAMNDASSRSHLVFILRVSNGAQLVLVDLAGSERLSKTEATGECLKEAQFINKSLSALGDVLHALGNKASKHIPYRNSKLTFLLQDALSGNAKVAFIACVSPEYESVSETFSTLSFAERIRRVELGAVTGRTLT